MKTFILAAALTLASVASAVAFEVPSDWKCFSKGRDTSCYAPGSEPKAKFPKTFFKQYAYPHEVLVQNEADWEAVTTGWRTKGDCGVSLNTGHPNKALRLAKAKYCVFHQKGYAAPKPKFVKGW